MLGTFTGAGLGFGLAFTLQDKFSKTADKIEQSMDSLDDKVNVVRSSINQMKVGGVLAAAGVAITAFFVSQVDKASDLEEALNKNREIFGDYASEIENFAKNANRIGLSDAEALDYIGDFGNILTSGAKLNEKLAKEYSLSLTEAAADLASFNNRDIKDTQRALRSAITGEFESIKSLGVKLNMKDLKDQIEATGQAWNNTTKTQAIYNAIMEQTIKAHGDFERTAKGFANAKRILRSYVNEIKQKIGSIALPMMEKLVQKLTGFAKKVNDFLETNTGQRVLKIVFAFGLLLTVVGSTLFVFGALRFAMTKIRYAIQAVRIATNMLTGSFAILNVELLPLYIIIGIIIAYVYLLSKAFKFFNETSADSLSKLTGFKKLFAILGGLLQAAYEFWKFFDESTGNSGISEGTLDKLKALGISEDTVEAIGSWVVRIKAIWIGFKETFIEVWNSLISFWNGTLKPAIVALYNYIGEKLLSMGIDIGKLGGDMDNFKEIGKVVAYVIMGILVIAIIALIVQMVALAVSVLAATWPILLIIAIIALVIYAIKNWDKIVQWFVDMFKSAWTSLSEWFTGFVAKVKNWGKDLITKIWDGVKESWSSFKNWITDKFLKLLDAIDIFGLLDGEGSDPDISQEQRRVFEHQLASNQLAMANTAVPRSINNINPNVTADVKTGDQHFSIMLDSDEISNKVIEKQDMNNSRS